MDTSSSDQGTTSQPAASQDPQGDVSGGASEVSHGADTALASGDQEFSAPTDYDRMQQIAEVVQRRLGIDDPNDLESWLTSREDEQGEVF